jgi:hypothetical protein
MLGHTSRQRNDLESLFLQVGQMRDRANRWRTLTTSILQAIEHRLQGINRYWHVQTALQR